MRNSIICCNTVSLILTPALGFQANLFWCFGGPCLLPILFFGGLGGFAFAENI